MNYIEKLNSHSIKDSGGNFAIIDEEAGLLNCADGLLVQLNEHQIELIDGVASLIPSGLDVGETLNLGDLSSPLSVICSDLETSPQR